LIEFVDTGASGFDGETPVQIVPLAGPWKDFVYVAPATDDNKHVITVESADGLFKAVLSVAGISTSAAGVDVKPTAMKIDVYINNFHYTGSGTKLALVAKVDTHINSPPTKEASDGEGDKVKTRVRVDGGGLFSWADTVTADGVAVNVIASSLATSSDPDDAAGKESDEDAQRIVYTFNTTTPIVSLEWDPTLGGPDGTFSAAAAAIPSAVVFVVAMAALAF